MKSKDVLLTRRAWLLGLVALAGCDEAGGSTSGARIEFPVRMQLRGDTAVVSRSGWRVTLTRAELALDALYFFAGESLAWQPPRDLPALWRGLDRALSPRTAHAHPGHYVEGDALGELISPPALDLLAGAELGRAHGVTGPYRSARVSFGQARGALAATMGDAAVILAGSAEREGSVRHFLFRARADALRDAAGAPWLSGCPFDGELNETPHAVLAQVDPAAWFAAADFSELAPSSAESPSEVMENTRLFRQIREQVKASAAVRFTAMP